MPGQSWLGSAASFMRMWVPMMVAMMLPSLVLMLAHYRRSVLGLSGSRLPGLMMLVATGYLLVWSLLGLLVYPVGVSATTAEGRWRDLRALAPFASGLLLLVAGAVQLTAWKARQLRYCRDTPAGGRPLSPTPRGAWQHGLRSGLHCTLCCSGFVMAMLAVGLMDLRIMGAIAVAITAERLAPTPERTARVTGFVFFAAAALQVAGALNASFPRS